MTEAFNHIATVYDAEFGKTAVGELQREIVRNYLDKAFNPGKQLNILELNCGTGDDAIWLASKGHYVEATDVSEKMLEVARIKAKTSNVGDKITFSKLDISIPEFYPTDKKFDFVFSNFGGLNCISPESFKKVIPTIANLLNPGGRFIAVIMPKACVWESIYFSFKGQFKKAFRRKKRNSIQVPVGELFVETWYYSPADIRLISTHKFKAIVSKPVGFFLPPSYLNDYFDKHPQQLGLLNKAEKMFSSFNPIAAISDHFLIDMEVKS